MLYHNIISSDEKRIIKKIILEQKKREYENTWYAEIIRILKKYSIDDKDITSFTKSQWKRMIKKKMDDKIVEENQKYIKNNAKCRMLNAINNQKWNYIEQMDIDDVIIIMKIRLNMIQVKCNFAKNNSGDNKCILC